MPLAARSGAYPETIKFLERVTGVPCTQISAWRRGVVSDLTGAFSGPKYNPTAPVLPDTTGQVYLTDYTKTLPFLESQPGPTVETCLHWEV